MFLLALLKKDMSKYKKLSHVIYYHVYHIVWTPKYRYRILDGKVREFVDESIRSLCEWKKIEILEMNIQIDHVHIVLSIEPRMSVSEAMGILKGKTAIKLFKSFPGLKKKPYWGNHFWSRGYCSSTIGLDEDKVRKYVKYQEEQEKREEAQQLGFDF
jgi:putative transposase